MRWVRSCPDRAVCRVDRCAVGQLAGWRGPTGDGVSAEKNLPIKWSPTENIAWKLALPQWSGATPVIWGDTIFLNVAEADGDDLSLWAVDRAKRQASCGRGRSARGNNKQRKQNMSSPSPVTDGTTVWVMTGTGILKAFDFKGNELWMRDIQKDYGRFGLNWGYANSPLLHEGDLYRAGASRDEDRRPVLHAADRRQDRQDQVARRAADKGDPRIAGRVHHAGARHASAPHTRWSSPAATSSPVTIRRRGKELWRADGLNPDNDPAYRIVASPVTSRRHRRRAVARAADAGAQGRRTRRRHDVAQAVGFQNGPDVPTPVTDGTYLYVVNDRGIAYCLDAQDRQSRSTGRSV